MTTSGTYQLSAKGFFYLGSSTDFRRRRADHQWRLRRGVHPCKRIQKAFDDGVPVAFTPIEFIRVKSGESAESFRARLHDAEQKMLDQQFGSPNIENKSRNAAGPDNGELLKSRWLDPQYRRIMAEHMTKIAQLPKSPETREKMAAAKRGARNVKSRAVIVTKPDQSTQRFESASDAAKFFNVSQQLFDQWMKGISAWPGTGRITRKQNLWVAAFSAKFE